MASVLGVDPSRIKIVSVYAGSVNIDIQVLSDAIKQVVDENGASVATEATFEELAKIQTTIDNVFTVDPNNLNDPNLVILKSVFGEQLGSILAASDITTSVVAEILAQCEVKPEDCPKPWPIAMGKDYNNFECAVGMTTSLSASDAEHCAYVALPDFDLIAC